MPEQRYVFVIGLDDFNRRMLETVRGSEHYRFHGLIPCEKIVNPQSYPIEELIEGAQRELKDFGTQPDAIIGHWDFPTTSLLPVLQAYTGLPGPTLESALCCENKYWTRTVQAEVAPEATPPFALVDPQDDSVPDNPPLPYPFWLKPVVAFSSTLGFRIDDRDDLGYALERTRPAIGRFAAPFNMLLRRARLEARRATLSGCYCIAEGMISGHGCTLEGYVLDGEPVVYGIVDSMRGPNAVSFVGYHYPTELPERISAHMIDITSRVIRHIGLDRSPFNVEYFWDQDNDEVKLLEVNARISKSHAPLFYLVEGASHHEVAIDVALGRRPAFPRREGKFRHAAKFMPRTYGDVRVVRAPTEEDIDRLKRCFPEVQVSIHIHQGMQLSELRNQDSYSFELADIFLGGDSREDLTRRFREAMAILDFRFSREVETNYG